MPFLVTGHLARLGEFRARPIALRERGRLVELRGASYRTRHIKRIEPDRSHDSSPAGISGNHRQDIPEPTRVYVLHVFQKKSKRGIATPKKEIELLRERLKWAERDYENWRKSNG